jgi:glycosyltransferase involved in cell wall biosynthesis
MAGLSNGVPTVTTSGALTEPVWAETQAVALAPASDPRALSNEVARLLRDRSARLQLGAAGKRTYDSRFSVDRTVDALCRQKA